LLYSSAEQRLATDTAQSMALHLDWFAALRRLQVPVECVVDSQIRSTADVERFPVLFAPRLRACPEDLRLALEAFVKAGGVLVTGLDAFAVDEYGQAETAEPLVGVRPRSGTSSGPGRAGSLVLASDQSQLPGVYLALVEEAELTTADVWITWAGTARPAAFRRVLGKGRVYTLLVGADASGWRSLLGVLLDQENVTRDCEVTRAAAATPLPAVGTDAIVRRDARFYCLVSEEAEPLTGRLVVRTRDDTPWYVTDVVSWQAVLTPTGQSAWTGAGLAAGIAVRLPPGERVLRLLTKTQPAGLTGEMAPSAAVASPPAAVPGLAVSTERPPPLPPKAPPTALPRPPRFVVHPLRAFPVDLQPQANIGFSDTKAGDGRGGWTDEGSVRDLSALPVGLQTLGGVPFDILAPDANQGRTCVALAGRQRPQFPQRAAEIWIGRPAAALYFLHAAAWPETGDVMRYRIHYREGDSVDVAARYPQEIGDWSAPEETGLVAPAAGVAWSSQTKANPCGLFGFEWRNPQPTRSVRSIDVVSAGKSVPFVVAITGVTAIEKPVATGEAILGAVLRPGWSVSAGRNAQRLVTQTEEQAVVQVEVEHAGTTEVTFEARPKDPPLSLAADSVVLELVLSCHVPTRPGPGLQPDLRVGVCGPRGRQERPRLFEPELSRDEAGDWRLRQVLDEPRIGALIFQFRQASRGSRYTFRGIWLHAPQ
jgi:hypothetical protein